MARMAEISQAGEPVVLGADLGTHPRRAGQSSHRSEGRSICFKELGLRIRPKPERALESIELGNTSQTLTLEAVMCFRINGDRECSSQAQSLSVAEWGRLSLAHRSPPHLEFSDHQCRNVMWNQHIGNSWKLAPNELGCVGNEGRASFQHDPLTVPSLNPLLTGAPNGC